MDATGRREPEHHVGNAVQLLAVAVGKSASWDKPVGRKHTTVIVQSVPGCGTR
jgi:hypothetical protein